MSLSDDLTQTDLQLPEFEEIQTSDWAALQPAFRQGDFVNSTDPKQTRLSPGNGNVTTASSSKIDQGEVNPSSNKRANSKIARFIVLRIGTAKFWKSVPSWFVSMAVHVGILLMLAAISLEPIHGALSDLLISNGEHDALDRDLSEISLDPSDSVAPEFSLASDAPSIQTSVSSQTSADFSPTDIQMDSVSAPTQQKRDVSAMIPQLMHLGTSSSKFNSFPSASSVASLSTSINGRSLQAKGELLKKYGGNAESEKGVALALKWLAEHQNFDGSWNFDLRMVCNGKCTHGSDRGSFRNRNAATGLALLPFLGAGHTHLEGEHKLVVMNGIKYLLSTMTAYNGDSRLGSWYGSGDTLYGHGIASIAICEAYAMTRDSQLLEPAQRAVNFITYAQNPDLGGWQYEPRIGSDTSVVAWQIMALKSAAMGGLNINPITLRQADSFLNSVQTSDGIFYGYKNPNDRNRQGDAIVTTSCALLCRIYMGMPKSHPQLLSGANLFEKHGPDQTNTYYNYYATQVMKQVGGDPWTKWNETMRNFLVNSQIKSGHMAGSWSFDDHGHGNPASTGGRLYFTAMSAMTLEVYYRYMPVYSEQSIDDGFKL